MENTNRVQIMASDAGGTMTDMIVVDADGRFSIGKVATTPHNQALGVWEALGDAFEYWNIDFEREARRILPGVEAFVYSGTSMMNVMITQTGRKIGVITQRGDEDIFLHERSAQTWAGYAYQDLLHHVTHRHNEPLVPRRLVKGVSGRIDMFTMEAIPLYEDEVIRGVEEVYPGFKSPDPILCEIREFYCPGCATLLKVDSAPVGYPIVFDILPDIDGFYREWLGRPLPDEKQFRDFSCGVIKEWAKE